MDESTLFRRNCFITKQLTIYGKKISEYYLMQIFTPIINRVLELNISEYEIVCLRVKRNKINKLITLQKGFEKIINDTRHEKKKYAQFNINNV